MSDMSDRILDDLQFLGKRIEDIDRKITTLMEHTNAPTERDNKAMEQTPRETGSRNNQNRLIDRINYLSNSQRPHRKKLELQYSSYDDTLQGLTMKTLATEVNARNLHSILLPDQIMSMEYEDVCKLLVIDEKRRRLSKISQEAVAHLQSLTVIGEKEVQTSLLPWISRPSTHALDTSESSLHLPNFKYAERGVQFPTGKPDVTCYLLPMRLEIKDTVGRHGWKLIDKEYELIAQMFERVLTDAGHNELLKRAICFGSSGRYGWMLLLERTILRRHDLDENERGKKNPPFIHQKVSLVKIKVEDIVRIWESLISQKGGDSSYYLDHELYYPIRELLNHRGLYPGWCRLRVAEQGSVSFLVHVFIADQALGVQVNKPDLCIKVFLANNAEVMVLNDIHTQTPSLSSPVRYVLSTLSTLPTYQITDFNYADYDHLFNTYLKGRKVNHSLSTTVSLVSSWWNPLAVTCKAGCSAILMYFGESYKGQVNRKVKKLLVKGLESIHLCGYLHTDIRPYNWLFFRNIPSSADAVISAEPGDDAAEQGTPLLIDFDQAIHFDPAKDQKGLVEVTTTTGARRDMMLKVTLEQNTGEPFQTTLWSCEDDLEILTIMIRSFTGESASIISEAISTKLLSSFNAVAISDVKVGLSGEIRELSKEKSKIGKSQRQKSRSNETTNPETS